MNIVLCNTEDRRHKVTANADARVAFGSEPLKFSCQEYRKYKVKGKPEGKELKRRSRVRKSLANRLHLASRAVASSLRPLCRMLGFIVVRGTGILYIQPEELGKEDCLTGWT